MAYVSTGGWSSGRPSKSTGKKGAAIGGQGVVELRLCIDCKHRPERFGKNPHAPACDRRPQLDAIAAREACGRGAEFERDR